MAVIDLLSHPGWLKPRLPPRVNELPDAPQPGFFLLRTSNQYDRATGTTHRGRWIIPAIIYRPCPWVQPDWPGTIDPEQWCCVTERSRPLRAQIAGADVHVGSSWGDPCSAVQEIWEWGRQISAGEYAAAVYEYAAFQMR